jgi:hypothetical protein
MKLRLLADENIAHALLPACLKLRDRFPMAHIAEWRDGECLQLKDPALLMTLREEKLVLVSFDRRSLAHQAGLLTREGIGHSGVILFRRIVSRIAYGTQGRLLVSFWGEASGWDWADRVIYLPR